MLFLSQSHLLVDQNKTLLNDWTTFPPTQVHPLLRMQFSFLLLLKSFHSTSTNPCPDESWSLFVPRNFRAERYFASSLMDSPKCIIYLLVVVVLRFHILYVFSLSSWCTLRVVRANPLILSSECIFLIDSSGLDPQDSTGSFLIIIVLLLLLPLQAVWVKLNRASLSIPIKFTDNCDNFQSLNHRP